MKSIIAILFITLLSACGGGDEYEDSFENTKQPCLYIPERDACAPTIDVEKGG